MNPESLKIMLALRAENTLLRRAISDATVMLSKRRKHFVLSYDDEQIHWLLAEIDRILYDLEKAKQNPPCESDKPDNSADKLP